MIKKKLNILLLLSLALLFISLLGTTSLAYQYHLTPEDIDTILARYPVYTVNLTQEQCANRIKWKARTYQAEYDTFAMYIYGSGNNRYCYVYGFNKSQVTGVSNINNLNYANIQINGTAKRYSVSSNYEDTVTGMTLGSGGQQDTKYHIWTNDLGSFATGPQDKPNILTFTPPESFTYARSEIDTELIDLDNTYYFNNQAEAVLFAYNPFSGDEINEADGVIVGYLWDADKFDKAIFSRYNFNPTTRLFEYSGVTWESKNIGNIHDNMIWVEFHARDYGNALKPDSIIHVEFVPNTTEFNNIHVDYYIRSPYSNIVDGKLNVGGTFSGDYSLMINNNNNTDKIIDNINNDTQVDSSLNEFVSGDAEDIANKFGFRLFNQEYYDFIYRTITRFTDVLQANGDVYFDYSMHGESPTRIYASSFTTPNGALKTFLSMFLVSCTVFAFYKYIADLLELISTGNILEALDEFKIDRNIFKM